MPDNFNYYNQDVENKGDGGFKNSPPPEAFVPKKEPSYPPFMAPIPLSPEEQLREEKKGIKRLATATGLSFCSIILSSFLLEILFIVVFLIIFGYKGFNLFYDAGVLQLLQISFSLFAFTLPFILIFKLYGFRISDIVPLKKSKKCLSVPLFLFGVAFCGFANIAASYLDFLFTAVGLNPSMPETEYPQGIFGFMLCLISTALVPALVEEFACRGIVLGALRKYGDGFALAVSSMCFGIMHGNFEQIPFAVINGLIMGFTVIKTESLRTAMAIHFLNNAVSVVFVYLPSSMDTSLQNVIYIVFLLCSLLGGILALKSKKSEEIFAPIKNNEDMLTPQRKKYTYFFLSAAIIIFIGYNIFQAIALALR